MSGDAPGGFSGATVGGGRYRLRSLLGEGGMASVHYGYDTVLERPVAVKTLHSELGREASFRERFRREAMAVARLNHTNIVSVYDSGEDEFDGRSVPFIVMELVDGKPLRQVLDEDVARYGAMPAEKALKITGDVLAALSASHEMGLVHRDIKPGNVMLTKRGVVKVMDFGIARALQSGAASMTQTGMVVGTPQYLSPEQALGRGVDARSDLYSVGCMLFELVTGGLPFDGDSPLSIAYQHVQEEPPVASSVNRSLPAAVDALISRALRKNPDERFPSADAMQEECERIAAALKGGATPLVISEGPRAHHGTPTPAAPFAGFPPATPTVPSAEVPAPAPYPAPPGGYGHPQPGYPQPAQPGPGYRTPPPAPGPGGYPTAPVAGPRSGAGSGPRSRGLRLPLVLVGAVVIIVAAAVIAAVSFLVPGKKAVAQDPVRSATSSAGGDDQVKQGDPSRTIEQAQCANPTKSFTTPGKVIIPDFSHLYIDSVLECLDAGHWAYTLKSTNEHLWGKGVVIAQSPLPNTDFNPDGKITLWVSTGRSSQ
ncbi:MULTISPECIES: protein kinase domain-containing protein [Streptomycetaceae]|uniref:non-specific serine/threonine protein kinase n=1 Tax=Streptantibioticus cattleyicolor (strain ATCC 35852 / DSM 46488 / JCM 4925 / NBRC 14057 / NRRL 8057) TaxID=1003195 RepID=F8JRB0_STREN|nr:MULTISPECIES: protein kinase [Streptomycetaceae]AEW95414.1 serine/threonine protein kinase [Streptantibioticus cattleyicolor NRRL 8057 = DSM 46488]MYS59984.1 protein kinase [Streptomyces sp. SID5468]CCB75757.1 Serine/threonine-protein kinase pksC [Streptantibioticus cattleyicolor NRRL 8057 = DSM 46488]